MKILFVHNGLSSFVEIDLDILISEHDVRVLHFKHDLKGFLTSLLSSASGVVWADLVFSWFGGFHALIPFILAKFLGRRRIVIASGYDVANAPELNYGNMRSGLRRVIGRFIFRLAHKILAVSQFTKQEAIHNAGVRPDKIEVIYHGLPDLTSNRTKLLTSEREGVLTVGIVDRLNLTRKGLLQFVRSAEFLPNTPFFLIGPWQDDAIDTLNNIAPNNVKLLGPRYNTDLHTYMQSAKVYVQASAYESFGLSLAEAMLSGCIPVVTNCGALPEVVGDTGYYVPADDLPATADAIERAYRSSLEDRERARERILANFSLDLRKKLLLRAVQEIKYESH